MPSIAEFKQQYPDLAGLDDEQVVDAVHQAFYADLPREQIAESFGLKPAAAPVAERTWGAVAKDVGITALKSAISVPETVVGMANLVSGGRAGKLAEDAGFRPKEAKAILDEGYSDQQKAAFKAVQDAEGIGGTLQAVVENPSVIAHSVLESAAPMMAGGVVARGLMSIGAQAARGVSVAAGGVGPAAQAIPGVMTRALGSAQTAGVVAGAAGEGIVMAGSAAEQIRQQTEDGLMTGKQALLAGATGVAGSAFSLLGGRVAQKFGFGDVDTMLSGAAANPAAAKGVVRSTLEAAFSEGVLEELPQSVVEQVLQNEALGRPLDEGVDQAAVLGTLAGAAMGGGANLVSRAGAQTPEPLIKPPAGPIGRAADKAPAPEPQAPPPEPLPEPLPQPEPEKAQALLAHANERARQIEEKAKGTKDQKIAGPDGQPVTVPGRKAEFLTPDEKEELSILKEHGGDAAVMARIYPEVVAPIQGETLPMADQIPDAEALIEEPRPQAAAQAPSIDPNAVQSMSDEDLRGYLHNAQYGKVRKAAGAELERRKQAAAADPLAAQPVVAPPAESAQTGDIMNPKGEPFKTKMAASRAKKSNGGEVVEVAGGWVVRPAASLPTTEITNNEQPAADTAGFASAADTAAADAVGGIQIPATEAKETYGALSDVQDAPQQPAGAEAQAAPAQAPAPAAGNAAATTGVPAAPGAGDVQADGVKTKKAPYASKEDLDHLFGIDKKRQKAIERIAKGTAYFGNGIKAREFINGNGLKDTHEVHQAKPGRFEVRAKAGSGMQTEDAATAIAQAAHQAATSDKNDLPQPTEAQKEAGNYQKGHIQLAGHDISIENPAGSRRRPEWPPLKNHYGYFKGSVGADKDHVDVFMTDRPGDESLPVFVVDQVNKDGSFDEHKVVMGTASEAEARTTYLQNYENGWTGLGAITQMTQADFKAWVRDPAKTKNPAGVLPVSQPKPEKQPKATPAAAPASQQDQVVNVPPTVDVALTKHIEKQKARIARMIRDADQAGMTLDEKARAQTKVKAAEATMRQMRLKRFDAEDAAVKAMESGDAGAFSEYADLFPDVADILKAKAAPAAKAPSANTIFTEDAAAAARARLKAKLGRLNSGIDPEMLMDGITLAGYHIEKGARTFAAYARAMVGDLGDGVKPYLQGWYMAVRSDPRATEFKADMEKASAIEDMTAGDIDALLTAKQSGDLVQSLRQAIADGNMPKDNPALKKLVVTFDGKPADPARMKQGQEALESAIVQAARNIVAKGQDRQATYDELLALYQSQPNLNIRTSTSIAAQAYSTPAPLAFLGSELAAITTKTSVYEPTAGNGMLTIGASPKNVTVNEIQQGRINSLKALGLGRVIEGDALAADVAPKSQDRVITNPPFGSIKDDNGAPTKIKVDGYSLGKIDHLIAARALETMKDGGRAVLIIGANKAPGGMSTDDRIFFNWLYSHYTVAGHFEVEGDLYARQGAGWPVRVITITGRAKSAKVAPVAGTIQRAQNWDQVYEHTSKLLDSIGQPDASASTGAGRTGAGQTQPGGLPGTVGQQTARGDQQGARAGGRGDGDVAGTIARVLPDRTEPASKPVGDGADEQRLGFESVEPDRLESAGKPENPAAAKPAGNAGADALATEGNQFQAPYTARSSRKDPGVLIPSNMAQPTQDALSRLEDSVGDIDEFARKELGYKSVEDLHKALMGLQVDSVATAIYQIKQGKAVVIADQTGIGKGRQAAAVIRWAARNGHTPVFVSVKPSLFTDMYGDLADIGTDDISPFIMNSDAWVSGEGGAKLFANKPVQHKSRLERIAQDGALPDGSNALFMTYSQINVENTQRRALMALAPNAVFILDESHNAAGASATGDFMVGVLDIAKGVTYLSATYAKRPDNMPLYFKTDIGKAAADNEGLTNAMAAGGLPLQTVVSNNLVKAGQMFRRERSYDGVSIESKFDAGNRALHERMSNEATKALRAIVSADRMFHSVFVKGMAERLAKMGASVKDNAGNQASASVQHTEFSSVVHNFVKQMLLGLKAQTAADEAIASLKRGEKPIIAVENTMGSFLNEYASANGIAQGASLGSFDYRTVLSRALARTLVITEKAPNGDEAKRTIRLDELDPVTRAAYDKAQAVIDGLKLDIPVSPIDWIRAEIQRAGYSVAEITGRNLAVDYSNAKAPVLTAIDAAEQNDKVNTTRQFNAGKLDALVLNVAGSTGISLHASEKFTDQRPRHMIVAQAAGDINTFMQMLGRIHRTGQVKLPKYTILSVDLPTEKRPTAVLSNKMKSLNANTSSNTESATSVKSSDILNKYGDQIVTQYLSDNYTLARELGVEDMISGENPTEDIARKATGRLALQPIATQHTFYDEVEGQYNALIEYLNKTNQNDLEPRTFDFDAKELRQEVLFAGGDPTTPFGEDAIYGEYSIKSQGVAMKPEEIRATMAENLGGKTEREHTNDMARDLEEKFKAFVATQDPSAQAAASLVRQTARDLLKDNLIGSTFRVDINGDPMNAVVLNIRNTHKTTGNPYSLSKMQVTLAVNSPLRSLTVPATQLGRIKVADIGQGFTLEQLFKPAPSNQRDTAKIITGNLLAAYGELEGTRGTIIGFTKEDGTQEQGILLPKLFDYNKNTRGDYRLPSGAAALKFLQTSDNKDIGRFGIMSRDSVVRVLPDGQGIRIQVPKSKAKGGKYFLDKPLIAVAGDFTSSGNNMVAEVNDPKAAVQALDALMKKQALYALPSMAEEAKQIAGEPPMFSRASAPEPRNLVTLHNLTAENLLYADNMGGIPVPSIGITKIDSPFGGFGDITMIAPASMVDPEAGVPVYDRDAWTARFPVMNFKKVKAKVADAFYERMKPAKEYPDGGQFMSMLWESIMNDSVQRPDKVVRQFDSYTAPLMMYAKEVLGKDIAVPMKPMEPREFFAHMPAWRKFVASTDWSRDNLAADDPKRISLMKEAGEAASEAIDEYAKKEASSRRRLEADDELVREVYGNLKKTFINEDGSLRDGIMESAKKGAATYGQKTPDTRKLNDAVAKVVTTSDPAYQRWVKSLVEPLFDAPTITLRGKEVQPTLDNIVDAMTIGATQGAEKSLTFGAGKTAAMLGKRYKSMAEIKADRDRVVSQAQENEGKKATDELLTEYRTKAAEFFTQKDWRGNIDTWAANDASMEALAKAGKAGGSSAEIRQALSRAGFKSVDQATINLASESIKALRNAATDYFEAKPQRAVKLSEFRGAVIPKGSSQEVKDALTKSGVTFIEYDRKTDGARAAAIQKLTKRLDKANGDVLFNRTGAASTLPASTVQQIADTIKARWSNAPEIIVVQNMDDARIDKRVRDEDARQRAGGAQGSPRGFFLGGKVYLVADSIASQSEAVETLFHEALGHSGLRGVFGEAMGGILDQIATMRRAEIAAKAREYGLVRKGADGKPVVNVKTATDAQVLAAMDPRHKRVAAEEVLAEMAQTRPAIGYVKRAIAAIRAFLRKNVPGFAAMRLTDADIIQQYIMPARAWVERGGEAQAGGAVKFQRVFHGTPHRGIEKFSTDKIGTGEGAQAYGWGLYFAGKKEIAEYYRETLTNRDQQGYAKAHLNAKNLVARLNGDAEWAAETLTDQIGNTDRSDPNYRRLVDTLEMVKSGAYAKPLENPGQLYKVEIPEDTEMLLWDKPLSEQPAKVSEALRGVIAKIEPFVTARRPDFIALNQRIADGDIQGAALYKEAEKLVGSDQLVSKVLGSLGIKGIKYLDGTSRADGDGSYNYVIFSGDDVAIQQTFFSRDMQPTIIIDGKERPTANSNGQPLAADEQAVRNFWRWFGDSKAVDAQGKPLVVYHGSPNATFTEFDVSNVGVFFSDRFDVAASYAGRYNEVEFDEEGAYTDDDQGVYQAHLSIKNPKVVDWKGKDWGDGPNGLVLDDIAAMAKREGFDGLIVENVVDTGWLAPGLVDDNGAGNVYVAFDPTQIKSATGNRGTFDGANPNIMFSRTAAGPNPATDRPLSAQIMQAMNDTFTAPGKLNWWHKSVGTQYNLAQRSPAFKKVFDRVQDFLSDVSYHATKAAQLAPNILPKLDTWRDIVKPQSIKPEDNKAIAAPIFEGTLAWRRDESGKAVRLSDAEAAAGDMTTDQKAQRLLRGGHITERTLKMWRGLPLEQYEKIIEGKFESQMLSAGIVFTDKELVDLFQLTPKQIELYREFRAATDKSLSTLAISDMLRLGGRDTQELQAEAMAAENVDVAAVMLRDHLLDLADQDDGRRDVLIDTANKMIEKADKVKSLINKGYAPLSRFGNYSLDVVDANGDRVYFGLFESRAESNKMARAMRINFEGATITQGTMSEEAYKLFAGVSPETLELFGGMLGLESDGTDASDKVFQEYLKLAKGNRSAMKRLIQRKGIAGFSEDAGRVLAGFIYSNARQTASGLHMGAMAEAASAIPNQQGELKDAAMRLVDYIKNPVEEASKFRGLLFAQYLGGSIASAMVNMLQPFQVTTPYLSQFGGARAASKEMARALGDVLKKTTGEADLDAALKRAEDDGIVAPQEVHLLMAQARGTGSLQAGDGTLAGNARATAGNALARVSAAWGKGFGAAEQFNRRLTFIASYRLAKKQGMNNPVDFAKRTIAETQFIYNKGNKPRWARGAVGGTLFTFKQYSISYLELLARMAVAGEPGSPERAAGQRAALMALGVLLMMGGAGGLPFVEDLEDVIDAIMQRLGYNKSSKQMRTELFSELFGQEGARFLESGVSGLPGAPIDVSGRLGLGNLIPGTGLFLKKDNHSRDMIEAAGPAGDMVGRAFKAVNLLVAGELGKAVETASPVAVRNAIKGVDIAATGMYRDDRGRKVIEADGYDALAKGVGFQPNDVARVQEGIFASQRMISLTKITESEIAGRWAVAIFEGDQEGVAAARKSLQDWNRKNPDTPIRINMAQISKRVRSMRESKAERIAKTAPKEMRAGVRRELAEQQQ